ncbi:MAG: DUF1287 domain-containing protein, partial [Caulobacteraceae bacterium]
VVHSKRDAPSELGGREMMLRRSFMGAGLAATAVPALAETSGVRLARAAQAQLGVTTGYDPAYLRLPYPGGDAPRASGVCADVIVRAARDGLGLDLQKLVHEDMARAFAAYPSRRAWGLSRPDANIDHRRVLNLEAFWRRARVEMWAARGASPGDGFGGALAIGDIVTWRLDGRLPHVAVVVDASSRPRLVHNIGGGAQEIPLALMRAHQAVARYRWPVA